MESACPWHEEKIKALCMYVSGFPLGCCDHNTLFFKLMLIVSAAASSWKESVNGHMINLEGETDCICVCCCWLDLPPSATLLVSFLILLQPDKNVDKDNLTFALLIAHQPWSLC
jgi:hypothetical protein